MHPASSRYDSDNAWDESSENAEPTRVPLKRVASGRFPVKVNGTDLSDIRSPNIGSRAPPIPNRSHYRGLSQQNTAPRRPSVMPLTIGNVNERLRSNSESLLRSDRSDGRNRRMGIVSKRRQSSAHLTRRRRTIVSATIEDSATAQLCQEHQQRSSLLLHQLILIRLALSMFDVFPCYRSVGTIPNFPIQLLRQLRASYTLCFRSTL